MRFFADGPIIPDDLLIARDSGDVIFFCGAGVSRHVAGLPDFLTLGGKVIENLGAGENSLARMLFERIRTLKPIDGVGGLIATDRIFSLLEREFEQRDVQKAVAEAIKPEDADLSAHRILLDLSRGRDGTLRLVTTNFDLLFEASDPDAASYGPPSLPDPRSGAFSGIVHLHGRVNAEYSGPNDVEFIVSSADFGRAYLSDGWATRFMQSLLARFQIVFVGYGADDPPVQYLLEALNLHAGARSRLFAFQPGSNADDAALWEHRGVRAIPFDNSKSYDPLWNTLDAWAERSRDIDQWYANLLSIASQGPAYLDPHVRGQVAHLLSTREGAKRVSIAETPIPASWLLALDPRERFARPRSVDPYGDTAERIDPYATLGLDIDTPPQPGSDDDFLRDRTIPIGSWDAFALTRFDQEDQQDNVFGDFYGGGAEAPGALSNRVHHIANWFCGVALQPIALWWAAERGPLHPFVVGRIEATLRQNPDSGSDEIREGWRLLISSWSDRRPDADHAYFDLSTRIEHQGGWSESRVRDYAALFRAKLKVNRAPFSPHPLTWPEQGHPSGFVSFEVEYPRPYQLLAVPDDFLPYAVTRFRENLDLARSLETEIPGGHIYLETTRPDDGASPIGYDSYGLTGPVAYFLQLMDKLVKVDPTRAKEEIANWPADDEDIFARLRIWAASKSVVSPRAAAKILLGFSDQVFWSSRHQRDLLYAIRDRWTAFSSADKSRFEKRILESSFPWQEEMPGGKPSAQAYYRLDRLHWLSAQGITFSFDLDREMAMLREIATDWSEKSGDRAAESRAPVVRSVDMDSDPRELTRIPLGEVIDRSREVSSQRDFFEYTERRPFNGLVEKDPTRALAALRQSARKGDVPVSYWSAFLNSEKRKSDSVRFVRLITGSLVWLPPEALSSLAYPVTEWLLALDVRLFEDFVPTLDRLWEPLIIALHLRDDDRDHQVDSSWANDGLNAPAGKLAQILLKDPSTKGRQPEQGFPRQWTDRAEELLALPGDMRRHALVMLGFQITWLHAIAPDWAAAQLLTIADDQGDDGDALWDGILWAGRSPNPMLFEILKRALLSRALSPIRRRAEANVIAAFLLVGWGADADISDRLVSSAELRSILVDSDDDLRNQVLWHFEHWVEDPQAKWYARLLSFLDEVWPHHRAVRTPEMSARLVDLALASGDLFPEVVKRIVNRVVPVRGGMLRGLITRSDADQHRFVAYPSAMLDLLWAVLAEDPTLWPYKVEEVLDALSEASETKGDPRLSELRRRRSS